MMDRSLDLLGFNKVLAAYHRALNEEGVFGLTCWLTLLLLFMYSGTSWFLRIPMTVLCLAAFLFRWLNRSPNLWLLAAVLMVSSSFVDWVSIDNHKYLMSYWCIALFCASLSPSPKEAADISGRLLIGLCFLFAAMYKMTSAEFLDGSFFHHALLFDPRFRGVAEFVGGVAPGAFDHNQAAARALVGMDSGSSVRLLSSQSLGTLALGITWWTIVVEFLLAVVFLSPSGSIRSRIRNPLLLLFLLTTYPIASVVGFGWLLSVMGFAQTKEDELNSRLLYLFIPFFLQLALVPWSNFVRFITLSL